MNLLSEQQWAKQVQMMSEQLVTLNKSLDFIDHTLCEQIIDDCGYDPEKESKDNLVNTVRCISGNLQSLLDYIREARK